MKAPNLTKKSGADLILSEVPQPEPYEILVGVDGAAITQTRRRVNELPIPYMKIDLACIVSSIALTAALPEARAQQELVATEGVSAPPEAIQSDQRSIWESGVGEGFRSTAQSITLSAGANYGIAMFGSREAHHLALVSLTYNHMLSHTLGEDHWYRGNFEFRIELFSGAQFSPSTESFIGLTPHLRYDFATGTRWIPFFDIGAGVTATSIGPPDLSGTFEFNLQAATGIQWFLKDNLALTLEGRYLHFSCAGLHKPNLGLNGVAGLLGVTFFF